MILKNGKRIDGCTDTLPIGTVQPFLGLTPPKGYLVCQGQLVSKTMYPELYAICGNLFGTATETDFYLPDLRGKTIAGYDANDATLNTLGALVGSSTHKHTTGNHTLTVAEMPNHYHELYDAYWTNSDNVTKTQIYANDDYCKDVTPNRPLIANGMMNMERVGGSQAHNHGDTGEASNYQPTIVMNWIVKAAMLIPEYFIVENTLESNDTSNALSAAQGKILNDKFSGYLPLSGGALTGPLKLSGSGLETLDPAGIVMDIYGNFKHKRENDADTWCITNYEGDKSLRYVFGTGSLQIPSELYVDSKKIARFKVSTPEFDETYASGAWFRVHENGGNMLMVGGGLQILKEVPSRTPFITIPGINSSYSSFQYSIIATGSNDVGFRFRAYNSGDDMVIDNEDCNLPVGWYNVTGFIYLRD